MRTAAVVPACRNWYKALVAAWSISIAVTPFASADTISFASTKPLNLSVTADAMTPGPDGNLWILDSQHNSVGQLTPAGSYASFAIPTPNARPWAIAVGADGNLWFTEAHLPGKIGRITPTGVVTEYPIPATMLGFPWSMAATADGSIWFLELGNASKAHNLDRVGRLDANGAFTETQVTNAVKLDAIAGALDGVWLFDDDPSTNLLMKMHRDGTIAYSKSMPSTTYSGSSAGVTALDGTFWFTHNTGLDRVNDDGSITEYHIPWSNAAPAGIALGADGNIWFTDYNNGQIGQLIASSATSGGQATINGSAVVGKNLAEIQLLPPSFAALASATDAVAEELRTRTEDGPNCPSPILIYRRDVNTPINLLISTLPPPATCADIQQQAVEMIGDYYRTATNGPKSSWRYFWNTVRNAGPSPSGAVNATIAYPQSISRPTLPTFTCWNTADASTPVCNDVGGRIICSLPSLDSGGGCLTTTPVVYALTPDQVNDLMVRVSAAATAPDPNLSNNVGVVTGGAAVAPVLPPATSLPITNPIGRGGH